MGKVVAVCISEKRGTKKTVVPFIDVRINYGILGDAHAGDWHRQVSLLAVESVDKMRNPFINILPGDFAENILTQGVLLNNLPIGSIINVGDAKLKITQIGKKCHSDCEIKKLVGTCVMPSEGVFAEVIKEGRIKADDIITVCGV